MWTFLETQNGAAYIKLKSSILYFCSFTDPCRPRIKGMAANKQKIQCFKSHFDIFSKNIKKNANI